MLRSRSADDEDEGPPAVPPCEDGARRPAVCVVMPVRDEAASLPESLGSILAQDDPPELLAIVVVDGGSKDGTAEIARRLARGSSRRVLVLPNPRRTAAAGRSCQGTE